MSTETDPFRDVIDEILAREGPDTHDPIDRGGRTSRGISERAHPEAWADGSVSEAEARAIYETKYITGPGFDRVPFEPLRNQLIDFGVTSGPALATSKLQAILGVDIDGTLGPQTLTAIVHFEDPRRLNNLLVSSRIGMIGRLVTKSPAQMKFLNGWIARAISFML